MTNSEIKPQHTNQILVGNIPCKFPIVTKPTTLRILVTGYSDFDSNNVYVWKKYEEMTGIKIDWTTVRKDKRYEVIYTTLMNGSNIDLIMRSRISANDITQYGENDLILDLTKNNMLQNYAPNFWAYLQTHPDTLISVLSPEGNIYSFPQVNDGPELRVCRKMFINKTWLKNVNMAVPKTTEELYRMLQAFRTKDPNRNGDPNDELPLCSHDWISIYEGFLGAFGLANRGIHNQIIDYDKETGSVRLIEGSKQYKSLLEYFNKLYTEKLIGKYVFTITEEQWYNAILDNRIGMFINTNLAGLPADEVDNWVGVEEALEGPYGDKMWAAIRAHLHSVGAAVIPTVCTQPEIVLRWLDYFWTDEGTLFYHLGVEGKTFTVNTDGTYDFMPYIYDEMKTANCSFDDVVAKYTPYPGGSNPTVEIAPYFKGGEMAPIPAKTAHGLFSYGPDEYWPSFAFTAEENERLNLIQTDMEKFCNSARMAFITGTKPFSEWDEYVYQLQQFNTDELLFIYQGAVNRYNEMKKKLLNDR